MNKYLEKAKIRIDRFSTSRGSVGFAKPMIEDEILADFPTLGMSKDASLRAVFDIPTRGNIHPCQCNKPFIIAVNVSSHF